MTVLETHEVAVRMQTLYIICRFFSDLTFFSIRDFKNSDLLPVFSNLFVITVTCCNRSHLGSGLRPLSATWPHMPDVSRKRAAIGQLRDNKRYGVSRSSQLAASVNQEAAVEEEVDDEEYEREMEKERRFIVDGDYVDSDFAVLAFTAVAPCPVCIFNIIFNFEAPRYFSPS